MENEDSRCHRNFGIRRHTNTVASHSALHNRHYHATDFKATLVVVGKQFIAQYQHVWHFTQVHENDESSDLQFEMWLLRMQTTWLRTGGHEEPVHSTKPSVQHHAQLRLHSSTQTIRCSQGFIWQRFLTKQGDVRPFLRSYTSSASQEIFRSFWKRFIAAFTTAFHWSLCSARRI